MAHWVRALAMQTWGPEFGSLGPTSKSKVWLRAPIAPALRGGDGWILAACWPPAQLKSVEGETLPQGNNSEDERGHPTSPLFSTPAHTGAVHWHKHVHVYKAHIHSTHIGEIK